MLHPFCRVEKIRGSMRKPCEHEPNPSGPSKLKRFLSLNTTVDHLIVSHVTCVLTKFSGDTLRRGFRAGHFCIRWIFSFPLLPSTSRIVQEDTGRQFFCEVDYNHCMNLMPHGANGALLIWTKLAACRAAILHSFEGYWETLIRYHAIDLVLLEQTIRSFSFTECQHFFSPSGWELFHDQFLRMNKATYWQVGLWPNHWSCNYLVSERFRDSNR